MDNINETIDNLRKKLKNANAESVRLSDYIARVINDNEISTRMASKRMERMDRNVKVLEGQLELAVSEKLRSENKLMEVEVQRDDFARELDKLKLRHEKQETKLTVLRQEIESMNEQKKEIFAKFKRMKSQETAHVAAVGALKRQFQENLCEFLNKNASRTEASTLESTNAEEVSANVSDDLVARQQTLSNGAGSSSNVKEQVNVDEPMETTSEHNRCQMESVVRRTQVVLHRLSMRKVSGTVIKLSTSINTSTGARSTKTKAIETHELVEMRRPSTMAAERFASQAIAERRPKRTLRCTLCFKPYVSRPSQALCVCQNKMNFWK